MVHPVITLIVTVINLYLFILFLSIVLSWLVYFNIINAHQPLVSRVIYILHRLTDPVLRHVRRVIPPIGGFDISPIVVFLAGMFLKDMLIYYFAG